LWVSAFSLQALPLLDELRTTWPLRRHISWLLFGRWWLSLVVAVGVSLWWGLFLVLVPAAWRQEAQAAADLAPPGVSAGPVIASTKPE
jgi:4-amino-4-deoxy-L-arabinose transferase-like glycosyltransferase